MFKGTGQHEKTPFKWVKLESPALLSLTGAGGGGVLVKGDPVVYSKLNV